MARVPLGFSGGSVVKNPSAKCRKHGFSFWVRKIPWRRNWLPTPVFSPGESHGQRSLVGYSSWGCRVGHNLVTKQQIKILGCLRSPHLALCRWMLSSDIIIIHNGLPQRILSLCVTVKLKCLSSESCPPSEGRKDEINISPTRVLAF